MSDPFEESKNPSLQSFPPSQLREQSVQQAVDFLNDPRVRSAHPGKALDFLRQKGIKDDELREAYRRCNLPFPNTIAPSQFIAPHNPVPQQYVPYQQPRTSWVSVFLGITAAAGIYTAVREVLRRYIVPLYFPDAARIADERRRREENTFQAQERQIAELRERIKDLVASSDRTTDRMERLSKSLSSSVALRERELSETSQLRTAIQQLSHTVSMSTGTSASQDMQASSSHPKDGLLLRDRNISMKQNSPRYSGLVETSGYRKSVDIHTDSAQLHGTGPSRNVPEVNGEQVSPINGYVSSSISRQDEEKPNEEDDFMAIRPAEIEESWKKGIGNACESSTSARSTSKGEGDEARPSEKFENASFDEPTTNADVTEDGLTTSATTELPAEEDDIGLNVVDVSRRANADASARQLFRLDMMQETNSVLANNPQNSASSRRLRPSSMPQMDTPLSDTEP